MTTLLLLLALLALPLRQDAPWPELDVPSPDGGALAEIRKATGQEAVPDTLARWKVAVHRLLDEDRRELLWSSFVSYRGEPRHWLLADDGSVLAHVSEPYAAGQPVVRILRQGEELAAIPGADLEIDPAALGRRDGDRTWLAEGGVPRLRWRETSAGPSLALEIPCRDGRTRTVDAVTGRLDTGGRAREEVRVEPAVPATLSTPTEVPFVESFSLSAQARTGEPVPVRVRGSHPTPAWKIAGFELAREGEEGLLLALTPRSAPTQTGGAVAQVLEPFETTARLHGLPPGRYQIEVRGREGKGLPPQPLEVLPAALLVRVRTTGGIAGIEEGIAVFATGVARIDPWRGEGPIHRVVPPEAMNRISEAIAALPAKPEPTRTPGAADLFRHELGWWARGEWRTTSADDLSAEGALAALLQELRALR